MKRIMVVHQSPVMRTLSAITLLDCGYEVLEAGSFDEACAKLKRQRVDLILCDSFTPGMERSLFIKGNKRKRLFSGNVPVVMMAVQSYSGIVKKGGKHDAGSILFKPFSKYQLLEAVRKNMYQ
jgi:CheY-like chemotaxis protein